MGKLVRGLIAAAIPVAVIVGIASCGQRPVVMTAAEDSTYTLELESLQLRQTVENWLTRNSFTFTRNYITWREDPTEEQYASLDSTGFIYPISVDYTKTDQTFTMKGNFKWAVYNFTNNSYPYPVLDLMNAVTGLTTYMFGYGPWSGTPIYYEMGLGLAQATTEGTTVRWRTDPTTRKYIRDSLNPGTTPAISKTNAVLEYQNIINLWQSQSNDNNPTYQNAYDWGFEEGYDQGLANGQQGAYEEGYNSGLQVGFRNGQASVTDETTAINTLFASLVSVPINVLNGLMPMAIWNTPIVGLMVTFMLLALLMWLIRKLLAR